MDTVVCCLMQILIPELWLFETFKHSKKPKQLNNQIVYLESTKENP